MDIITKINGKSVASSTEVYRAVENQDNLKLTVLRGSDTITLSVSPEVVG